MDLRYGITDSKPWRWPKRQVSRQMSFTHADYYTGEVEYAAAVAAAAFAISNLESAPRDWRGGPRTSLEKTRSQKEPRMARPDRRVSESYTDEDARRKRPGRVGTTGTLTEKIIRQVPSMKRTPTFPGSKRYSEDTQSWKPEIDAQIPAFPPQPPTGFVIPPERVKRTPTFSGSKRYSEDNQSWNSEVDTQIPAFPPLPPTGFVSPPSGRVNKPEGWESEADAWERAQLDKIKQRYEKLDKTILQWEDKKRKQAHRKLEKSEGAMGKRRAKALQEYQNQIEGITQVAEGARKQAKENRRKEELKVHEKANKFQATGQLPRSCLCF